MTTYKLFNIGVKWQGEIALCLVMNLAQLSRPWPEKQIMIWVAVSNYACVEASNAILALGFMQKLNIEQMRIIDVSNADGASVFESFWQ